MPDVLELADRLWRGEASTGEFHPVRHLGGMAEICDGVAFVPSFANVSAFQTEDGLVLVDTGSSFLAAAVHEELRRWSGERLALARGDRARGTAAQVRPVHHDCRLQRGDQPAPVRRARLAVAGRVPL